MPYNADPAGYRPRGGFHGQRMPMMRGGRGRGSIPPWSHQKQQQGQMQPNLRQQAQVLLEEEKEIKTEMDMNRSHQEQDSPPVAENQINEDSINHSTPLDDSVDGEQDLDTADTTLVKSKPHWAKGPGKVNKRELRRRRNVRLRKMLQPKNALMVLNELVGNTPYQITDLPDPFNGTSFQCHVEVEGIQHTGQGKSKPAAKNAAAEAALKYMVLEKMRNPPPVSTTTSTTGENEAEMKMDSDDADLSWSHVACYALHKLLNSWDEGGMNLGDKISLGGDLGDSAKIADKNPSKKLPQFANTMNPVMLLNQMCPTATFEEVSREGNPPNIQFTVKCTVGNDAFYGTSTMKKLARRLAAFAACRHLYNIQYTPEFLKEQGFFEEAIKFVPGNN